MSLDMLEFWNKSKEKLVFSFSSKSSKHNYIYKKAWSSGTKLDMSFFFLTDFLREILCKSKGNLWAGFVRNASGWEKDIGPWEAKRIMLSFENGACPSSQSRCTESRPWHWATCSESRRVIWPGKATRFPWYYPCSQDSRHTHLFGMVDSFMSAYIMNPSWVHSVFFISAN